MLGIHGTKVTVYIDGSSDGSTGAANICRICASGLLLEDRLWTSGDIGSLTVFDGIIDEPGFSEWRGSALGLLPNTTIKTAPHVIKWDQRGNCAFNGIMMTRDLQAGTSQAESSAE